VLVSTRCPRCAKHLSSDAAFCPRCGRDLRAPHGLGSPVAPPLSHPRRIVLPPSLPTRHRVNGRPAILAFALFALLFILGMLFSTHAGMRVKPATPSPVDESTAQDGGGWGDDDTAGSTHAAPKRKDSHDW
jgi:hypothetical protein